MQLGGRADAEGLLYFGLHRYDSPVWIAGCRNVYVVSARADGFEPRHREIAYGIMIDTMDLAEKRDLSLSSAGGPVVPSCKDDLGFIDAMRRMSLGLFLSWKWRKSESSTSRIGAPREGLITHDLPSPIRYDNHPSVQALTREELAMTNHGPPPESLTRRELTSGWFPGFAFTKGEVGALEPDEQIVLTLPSAIGG